MTYQFMLQANGYHIVFNGRPIHLDEPALDALIEFQLHPSLGGTVVQSVPTFIRVSDLQRFLTYLEGHIGRLQQNPNSTSEPFVTGELGFQAQAHEGDIQSQDEGGFSLSFMVNVGICSEPENGTRVYVGGEALISVHEIQNFTRTVQLIIEELPRNH